jgi:hypothetical protein
MDVKTLLGKGDGDEGGNRTASVLACTIVLRRRRRLRRHRRRRRRCRRSRLRPRRHRAELCNFNYFISGNPSNIQRKEGTGGWVLSRERFCHAQRNSFAVVVASIFLYCRSPFSPLLSPPISPTRASFHFRICQRFYGFGYSTDNDRAVLHL